MIILNNQALVHTETKDTPCPVIQLHKTWETRWTKEYRGSTEEQEDSISNGKTLLFFRILMWNKQNQTKAKHEEKWGKQNFYTLSPAVYTETSSFTVDVPSK